MKYLSFSICLTITTLVYFSCQPDKEKSFAEQSFSILDGDVTQEFPAVAHLEICIRCDVTPIWAGYCTGTLISPRHVLTAAHCLFDEDVQHINIRFDKLDGTDLFYTSDNFDINPNYVEGPEVRFDQALIKLATDVDSDITPIPLYGDILERVKYYRNRDESILQIGYDTTYFDYPIKTKRWGNLVDVSQSILSFINFSYYPTTCIIQQGDSGSPAILFVQEVPYVIGVLNGCDLTQGADLYSDIYFDDNEYVWIRDVLRTDLGNPSFSFDGDSDGIFDEADNCPVHSNLDSQIDPVNDGDGRAPVCDNCPSVNNIDQKNDDIVYERSASGQYEIVHRIYVVYHADEMGDACDPCPAVYNEHPEVDSDGDGLPNDCDLCPDQYPMLLDPAQLVEQDLMETPENDFDGDGFGNLCDLCPHDNPGSPWLLDDPDIGSDSDGDTVGDRCDLCPIQNPQILGADSIEDYKFASDGSVSTVNDTDVDGVGNLCDLCRYQNPSRIDPSYSSDLDRNDNPENDNDRDGLGDLCDNCRNHPNVDQANCDAWWDAESGGSNEAGDACDPNPCFRLLAIKSSPGCIRPLPGLRNPSINLTLGYVGFPVYGIWPALYWGYDDELVISRVINTFCDCEDNNEFTCMNPDINNCGENNLIPNNPLFAEGTGWLFLLRRDDGGRGHTSRNFRRLYSGALAVNVCSDEANERRFQYGCNAGDDERWYSGDIEHEIVPGYETIGQMNSGQIFSWAWTHESEISEHEDRCSDTSCSARVRFYFNVLLSDETPHEGNAFFYPSGSHHMPGGYNIYEARASCQPCPLAPTGECLGEWLRKMETAARLGRLIQPPSGIPLGGKMPVIHTWNVNETVELYDFTYSSLNPNSLVKGMALTLFDGMEGRIAGYARSTFNETSDIIDVEDFSGVSFGGISASAVGHEGLPSDAECAKLGMPEIWIFGGRDVAGTRSDMWHGLPATCGGEYGDNIYRWIRYAPQYSDGVGQASPWPSPRMKAALFFDEKNLRLVLYGGENESGTLNDLWFFDTGSLQWLQGGAAGKTPGGLRDFSFAQGKIGNRWSGLLPAVEDEDGLSFERDVGFLWGGTDGSGNPSNALYVLHLATGEFRSYSFPSGGPPGMVGSSIVQDPASWRLFLFGGYDEALYHNWLWSLDLESHVWRLEEEDCTSGTCPYPSMFPSIIINGSNLVKAVFAGENVDPRIHEYSEPYFLYRVGQWQGGREEETWAFAGDCDGDGTREELYGSRCATYPEWWNPPGKNECDSIDGTLVCSQEASIPASVYRHHAPGVKQLRARGDILFYTKGGRLFSADVSDPARLSTLDGVKLGDLIRDIEIWGGRVVAAAGTEVMVVDAENPEEMRVERTVHVCGTVLDIDVVESSAFFLTTEGIGRVELQDDSSVQEKFSFLQRTVGGAWEAIDAPPGSCPVIHPPWGFFCGDPDWRMLSEGLLDVEEGRALMGSFRDLIIVDLDPLGYSVVGTLRLDSKIEGLKVEDGFAYLNLKRGSTPLVDVSDPAAPSIVGSHDVRSWVSGVETGRWSLLRQVGSRIEMAVLP